MAVTDRQREYLDAMGIQAWLLRYQEVESVEPDADVSEPVAVALAADVAVVPVAQIVTAPAVSEPVGVDDWQRLEYQVAQCTACDLHQQRKQAVFGAGNHQADWMIVTEVPGLDEDEKGEAVAGSPGQLLDAMLRAVGLQREQVFVTNIIKCRPQNRAPRSDEIQQCQGFLQRQVALVQPRVILAMGTVAAQTLLDSDAAIGQLRGQKYTYGEDEIPVVASYHPAYLLRSPKEKRHAWQDLQMAQQLVATSAV